MYELRPINTAANSMTFAWYTINQVMTEELLHKGSHIGFPLTKSELPIIRHKVYRNYDNTPWLMEVLKGVNECVFNTFSDYVLENEVHRKELLEAYNFIFKDNKKALEAMMLAQKRECEYYTAKPKLFKVNPFATLDKVPSDIALNNMYIIINESDPDFFDEGNIHFRYDEKGSPDFRRVVLSAAKAVGYDTVLEKIEAGRFSDITCLEASVLKQLATFLVTDYFNKRVMIGDRLTKTKDLLKYLEDGAKELPKLR